MSDFIDELYGLKPEGDEGENAPQIEDERQAEPPSPQEAPGETESVIRIEFIDDGAEKMDAAILEALGGEPEGAPEEMEETEEDLPVAWDLPTGDKKVAVMIPNRGAPEAAAPTEREEEDLENGTNNGS